MPEPRAPGVYFGLPDTDYHADPSLSSTGIRNLAVSPEHFWENSPMNPDYENTRTKAMDLGTAYHKAILEGLDAYEATYATTPRKDDYPEALDKLEDLKEHCRSLGLKVSGTKAELCARIREVDPDTPLWPEIMTYFEEQLGKRIVITAEADHKVRRAVDDIASHPNLAPLFRLGGPEVSIFVRDPESGCPLKARVDYLGPLAAVDLKTFSNSRGAPVDRAIAMALAYEGYHVQGVTYWNVIEIAKKLPPEAFHGAPDGFVEVFREAPPHRFVFVFVGTDTPHIRARELARHEDHGRGPGQDRWIWVAGQTAFNDGIRKYLECMERFGTDRWHCHEPIRPFSDLEVPAFVMET